jgi:hypothetical protein
MHNGGWYNDLHRVEELGPFPLCGVGHHGPALEPDHQLAQKWASRPRASAAPPQPPRSAPSGADTTAGASAPAANHGHTANGRPGGAAASGAVKHDQPLPWDGKWDGRRSPTPVHAGGTPRHAQPSLPHSPQRSSYQHPPSGREPHKHGGLPGWRPGQKVRALPEMPHPSPHRARRSARMPAVRAFLLNPCPPVLECPP